MKVLACSYRSIGLNSAKTRHINVAKNAGVDKRMRSSVRKKEVCNIAVCGVSGEMTASKKEKPVSPQSQQGTMLTTLKRIVQEMNQIPALDTALFRLASRVKQTDVDSCSIYLADYDTQEFILKATDGLHPDAVEQVRGFSEGLIGLVGLRKSPLISSISAILDSNIIEVQEENYNAFRYAYYQPTACAWCYYPSAITNAPLQ